MDHFPATSSSSISQYSSQKKLCYLDSAATCLIPQSVSDAIFQYHCFEQANSGRGLYGLSANSDRLVKETREKVANFIHAKTHSEIVFTHSATDAIHLAAHSIIAPKLNSSSNIIISVLEHHANYLPWQALCDKYGATLHVVGLIDGKVDIDELERLVDENTVLVAISHVSNVLGCSNDVKRICQIAAKSDALTLVDGSQAVAHKVVDVSDIGCDFYVFSGHKMYAGFGIGVLCIAEKLHQQILPVVLGGGIVDKVSKDKTQFKSGPACLEVGSMNVSAIVGLSQAIDFLNTIGRDNINAHLSEISQYLKTQFELLSFIEPLSCFQLDSPIFSFNIKGVHSHDVATILDGENICVRAGHHCAQPLHGFLNINSSVRVSLGYYSTKSDIDRLIEGLTHAFQLLGE